GDRELEVLDPGLGGLATRVLDEPRRGIGSEREARRSDELSQSLRRLAEAAPDVDAAPPLSRRKQLEDILGDLRERADEHLAVRLPPLVEDRVPGPHGFLVRDRHRTSGWGVVSGHVVIVECGHAASFVRSGARRRETSMPTSALDASRRRTGRNAWASDTRNRQSELAAPGGALSSRLVDRARPGQPAGAARGPQPVGRSSSVCRRPRNDVTLAGSWLPGRQLGVRLRSDVDETAWPRRFELGAAPRIGVRIDELRDAYLRTGRACGHTDFQ